jgi:VWFA-related protein
MNHRKYTAAAILSVTALAIAFAQEQTAPPPSVEIRSPEAGTYVSGPTTLRADIVSSSTVSAVAFFVDGRETCALTEAPYECLWDAGQTVTEHQIRVVAGFADGTRVARSLRTKGLQYAENVDVDAVQVTVTITDGNGRFIGGVPRASFHILEDGRPQTVSYFAATDVPLELLVAVDISGSMTPAMPKLKKAVKDFLAAVPMRHQVTLLGFNDSIFALTRRATDLAERAKAVDRLAPWGATALYDVIVRGTNTLGRQLGRKALIVFTDGEDQGSHVTLEDVERRLQSSDITLYMIGQGRGVSVERLKRIMRQLCTPTGGRAFTTDSIDELHGAFDELLDELAHQYLLGYQPAGNRRDDAWHEIKVQVDGHTGVRARQGYRLAPTK